MIEEFAEVVVDGWIVTAWDPEDLDVEPDLDRLLEDDDEPLARVRAEESRARVRALAESALERPAYGCFEDDGRFRLLPGDPGHVEAALLSIPGARLT